ncbi:MAG: membrane protein insertion efficiency factor YidD [Bdellovibrionales bacterium]|nr:membrane protein insertion efficiency factor YidD [Bdellovibrionales bacterium]
MKDTTPTPGSAYALSPKLTAASPSFTRLSSSRKICRFFGFLLVEVLCLPPRLWHTLVSPCIGDCCRFYPSCSVYACEALRTHGVLRGLRLAVLRVARCNPLFEGGPDPVPPRGLP